jgi:hypothetical protein
VAGRSVDGVEHSTLEELEKSVKSSEMLFTICTDRGIEGGVLLRRGLPLQPGTNGIRDLAACGVDQDARYELAPPGIAACHCASCGNAEAETRRRSTASSWHPGTGGGVGMYLMIRRTSIPHQKAAPILKGPATGRSNPT